jgi:hypothetical protein
VFLGGEGWLKRLLRSGGKKIAKTPKKRVDKIQIGRFLSQKKKF